MTHAHIPISYLSFVYFTAIVSRLRIRPINNVTSKYTKFDKNGFFSVVQSCWSARQVGGDCHPRPARPEGDRHRLGSQDQQDRHLLGRQERICLEP
jgi:hypothetical protein